MNPTSNNDFRKNYTVYTNYKICIKFAQAYCTYIQYMHTVYGGRGQVEKCSGVNQKMSLLDFLKEINLILFQKNCYFTEKMLFLL